jgi:hypothetical protein
VVRWLALAVVVLAPVTVLVIFTLHGLLWEALVTIALIALAGSAGRRALTSAAGNPGMPAREVPPPKHAFLIMNPRSGGGKVARFGLKGQGRRARRRSGAAGTCGTHHGEHWNQLTVLACWPNGKFE